MSTAYPRAWLSHTEVAAYLDLHPMTIYKLLRLKQLPAAKVGGQWRIHQQQLDTFLFSRIKIPQERSR